MKKYAAFLVALLAFSARPAFAADKQHLQMMAEIRLLQEQQQQLQQLVGALQDTLKTLNTKLDDQAQANRKAMADQQLAVNNINENVRVLREKTDETNVRISSVSQEIDAMRQAVAALPQPQQGMAPMTQPSSGNPPSTYPANNVSSPGAPGGAAQPPATAPVSSIPPGASPQRMFDTSYDDYTAGRYDLAIQGFQSFIAQFPTLPQAADAQYNVGMSYFNESKWNEARDAFMKVIAAYPQAQGTTLPDAYYKLGSTYEHLNQIDAAKQAYQTVLQKYPNASSAPLANSALQRLNRR
jgi:tol-pal system protein YbgF